MDLAYHCPRLWEEYRTYDHIPDGGHVFWTPKDVAFFEVSNLDKYTEEWQATDNTLSHAVVQAHFFVQSAALSGTTMRAKLS